MQCCHFLDCCSFPTFRTVELPLTCSSSQADVAPLAVPHPGPFFLCTNALQQFLHIRSSQTDPVGQLSPLLFSHSWCRGSDLLPTLPIPRCFCRGRHWESVGRAFPLTAAAWAGPLTRPVTARGGRGGSRLPSRPLLLSPPSQWPRVALHL